MKDLADILSVDHNFRLAPPSTPAQSAQPSVTSDMKFESGSSANRVYWNAPWHLSPSNRARAGPAQTPSVNIESATESPTSANSESTAPAPVPRSASRTQSTASVSTDRGRIFTPPTSPSSSRFTPLRPEPQMPSRLVSTPGASKTRWYAVVVGRRTGVFDDW